MPNILITSPDLSGSTSGAINGDTFKVPHNKETFVSDEQYEVLTRADLGPAKMKKLDDNVDAEPAKPAGNDGPKAGTESAQGPATPASTSEGGNALLGVETAQPQGADTASSTAENHNGLEGDQQDTGKDSGSSAIDVDQFLGRSIDAMSGDIDGLKAKDVAALIKAESARETPRTTLLDKLEAKKTQLAAG